MADGATRPRVPAGADSTPTAGAVVGRSVVGRSVVGSVVGRRPSATALVIAACAALAVLLRAYQLSRPGYLLGVTEYDDGALFGDSLQFVSGVLPYRDFQMVQPPGGMLIMAPAALLAKVTGTAYGLAVARMLTVGADTVNVVLLGLLVRHRGALTAGIACGLYAVYPDALTAAHTFMLEPWLNLCCLLAALALFDGDRLAGTGTRAAPDAAPGVPPSDAAGAPRGSGTARLAWAGVAFGFGAAVKIWALAPLAVAGLLLLAGAASASTGLADTGLADTGRKSPARRTASALTLVAARLRPAATLAGGAVIGLGVPLLPFAVLAPGGLARGVLIGQLARNSGGSRNPWDRLIDMAGLRLLPATSADRVLVVVLAVVLVACYGWAYLGAGRRPAWLDAYAAAAAIVVTVMFLWPRLYYSHYGAFTGPFLALAVALPAGLLAQRVARSVAGHARTVPAGSVTAGFAAVLTAGLVWGGYAALRNESALHSLKASAVATADRLIPAGSCVVTSDASYTVAADRFFSSDPDCPPMVDSFGTLFAMTSGGNRLSPPAELRPVVELWQSTVEHAQYVWLVSSTVAQIPWNSQLYGYFHTHFRLIGLKGPRPPARYHYVPRPGLYVRT